MSHLFAAVFEVAQPLVRDLCDLVCHAAMIMAAGGIWLSWHWRQAMPGGPIHISLLPQSTVDQLKNMIINCMKSLAFDGILAGAHLFAAVFELAQPIVLDLGAHVTEVGQIPFRVLASRPEAVHVAYQGCMVLIAARLQFPCPLHPLRHRIVLAPVPNGIMKASLPHP